MRSVITTSFTARPWRVRAWAATLTGRGVPSFFRWSQLPARQDPEMDYIRTRYAAEFRAAIGTAMTELEPRERTLLRLGLVDGLTADQIAGVYGVHRVTVARWLAAAREHLAGRCQRRLEERLHLGPTELRSLLGLVRSQLDLSVRRLLSVLERVE